MNSRMMTRTLMSAITIALEVTAAFGMRASCSPSEPTASCASVIADRASQTKVSRFSTRRFTGSPHHVEQREDEHPQEIDRVPVRCTRFDDLLRTPRGTPDLVDGDSENDEADQQV